jgi:hypothetical protein
MYPSQPELNNNCTKVHYKRGRLTQEEIESKAKRTLAQPNFHFQSIHSSTRRSAAEAGPENMPKPPPIYVTDIKNILLLTQMLEKIATQQYEIKVLADNQVKFQPKTSEPVKQL